MQLKIVSTTTLIFNNLSVENFQEENRVKRKEAPKKNLEKKSEAKRKKIDSNSDMAGEHNHKAQEISELDCLKNKAKKLLQSKDGSLNERLMALKKLIPSDFVPDLHGEGDYYVYGRKYITGKRVKENSVETYITIIDKKKHIDFNSSNPILQFSPRSFASMKLLSNVYNYLAGLLASFEANGWQSGSSTLAPRVNNESEQAILTAEAEKNACEILVSFGSLKPIAQPAPPMHQFMFFSHAANIKIPGGGLRTAYTLENLQRTDDVNLDLDQATGAFVHNVKKY